MKEKLIKLKEVFIARDMMFICNSIFYMELEKSEAIELRKYLEKHKPKKIPKNNNGGWFELNDRKSRIKFLDKLIKKL